jgi:hypothetical protein
MLPVIDNAHFRILRKISWSKGCLLAYVFSVLAGALEEAGTKYLASLERHCFWGLSALKPTLILVVGL